MIENQPFNLSAFISTERLQMSERNREHFDIEAADHLELLRQHPDELQRITRSIQHRAELHKSRNMFLVRPMLFPHVGESETDHEQRENDAWGIAAVESVQCPEDTPKAQSDPIPAIETENEQTIENDKQEDLFQCPEIKSLHTQ